MSYYQVGEIRPVEDNVKIDKDSKLVYLDDNVFVEYSFWGSYGEVYFVINNISDKDITIHLDKSFFIRNGRAYDYFQNRTYVSTNATAIIATSSGSKTKGAALTSLGKNYFGIHTSYSGLVTGHSSSNVSSSGFSSSNSNSVQQLEVAKMIIPAKSFKIINQFNVTDFMYRSCDLYLWKSLLSEDEAKKRSFRSNGEILNKLIFNTENTPLLFENRLVYSLEDSDDKIEVVNKFYVKSIQNMQEDEFEYYVEENYCGEDKDVVIYKAQFAPNKYYIKYDEYSFDSNY